MFLTPTYYLRPGERKFLLRLFFQMFDNMPWSELEGFNTEQIQFSKTNREKQLAEKFKAKRRESIATEKPVSREDKDPLLIEMCRRGERHQIVREVWADVFWERAPANYSRA